MASRPMEQQGNFRGASQQQAESTSVIDQYSNFDGTYNSARDLRVEGQVKGTIVVKGSLHVAQGANVKAAVDAEAISVAGELDGEITCRGRLELLPTGRVKGEISTQSLVIHEGAVYEGDLEMGNTPGRSRRSRSLERERTETTAAPVSSAALDTPVAAAATDEATPVAPEVPASQPETPAARPSSFIRRFGGQESQTSEATEE